MASNISYERRKAVALAWKNEKERVTNGCGTRDWSQKEQKEILSKGKATGYQGHHMKSVDGHNSRAGDSNNIQFLTRKEHLAAHNGDFHNNTNGYYDPKTGETKNFSRNKPSIEARSLSDPLSEGQKKRLAKATSDGKALRASPENEAATAKTREQAAEIKPKSAESSASEFESKTLTAQRSGSKGETTESKTLAKQRSESSSHKASNSAKNNKSESNGHGH